MTSAAGLGYGAIMARLFLLAAAILSLGACGTREALRPPPGEHMPPAPALAAEAPTTEELLTPPPVARPGRQEDSLRRSEEREDDRFDLPPTG